MRRRSAAASRWCVRALCWQPTAPAGQHVAAALAAAVQVTFDEKASNATELLQLVNDVFAELDRAHRVDVREEPPEAAGQRLVAFLQVLKYPLPADL